ncbi:tRNA (guanine(37)-N1)-methyltransferase [Dirofilaria immitis]
MRYGFNLFTSTPFLSVIKILGERSRMNRLSSMYTISNKVQGITVLTDNDKKLFSKEITLPIVVVPPNVIGRLIGCKEITNRTVERFCNKIKPVIDMPTESKKAIVFCPEKMNDNTRNVVLKSIENLTGWTRVRWFFPNRSYCPCKFTRRATAIQKNYWANTSRQSHQLTVVNKLDAIGHKYRTFELDLLAGEENYKTEVHEEKLRYHLDFSQVFYNPRLSTEHKRIVRKITKRSVFYDCCAGIGPFVLPVVRNGAHHVLANDLNPHCIDYIKRNMELNHLSFERLKLYNMDATMFIKTVIADDLANEAKNYNVSDSKNNTPADAHVVMNLPGTSLQFLPYFRGCLQDRLNLPGATLPFPLYVHCHFFVKAPDDVEDSWYFNEAQNLIHKSLGISKLHFTEVRFVRNVAGRKKMFCATFQLHDEFLFIFDTEKLEVEEANNKELAETIECSDNSSSNERTCAQQTFCKMQIEELEPIVKKKKLS